VDGNFEWGSQLWDPIKIDVMKLGCDGVYWHTLVQDEVL
jgi:hypothetical protein